MANINVHKVTVFLCFEIRFNIIDEHDALFNSKSFQGVFLLYLLLSMHFFKFEEMVSKLGKLVGLGAVYFEDPYVFCSSYSKREDNIT
ncbi:hypothetical protein VNO77_18689 [Canavalia gladiata]|uniref:Uncharacterized protein n=1 Tax=Canavalia gladiata TaxID=3824 RepID=A0AAN9QHW5_CANGL